MVVFQSAPTPSDRSDTLLDRSLSPKPGSGLWLLTRVDVSTTARLERHADQVCDVPAGRLVVAGAWGPIRDGAETERKGVAVVEQADLDV